jgi:protein SCO1/2
MPSSDRGRRRPPLVIVGFAALGAVVGIGAGIAVHGSVRSASARPEPRLPALHGQAFWPAGKRAAPEFVLHDQHGRLVSLRSQRNRTLVIAFMDSRCHQVCPLEGRDLSRAIDALPAAARPTLLVLSVDPWADTRASARAAGKKWGFTGSWHWLLGSERELAPVWRAYRIYVKRAKADIIHSDAIYLVDRSGFERAGYLYPFLPGLVQHDLRVLAGKGSA